MKLSDKFKFTTTDMNIERVASYVRSHFFLSPTRSTQISLDYDGLTYLGTPGFMRIVISFYSFEISFVSNDDRTIEAHAVATLEDFNYLLRRFINLQEDGQVRLF